MIPVLYGVGHVTSGQTDDDTVCIYHWSSRSANFAAWPVGRYSARNVTEVQAA